MDPPQGQGRVERAYGKLESGRKTQKVEAFADDNSVMGKNTPEALPAIKEILADFSIRSGLKCNVDKSKIMFVGMGNADPEQSCGFEISSKLSILGFEITKNFADISDNFDSIIEKIRNSCHFWQRFRLTLPGRINVAKCLMLSQLAYVGSVVMPEPEQIDAIQ
jgi:hypothetical protein